MVGFFYIYRMKKIFGLVGIFMLNSLSAQFKVEIETTQNFTPNEVYLYTLNGSKDILGGTGSRKGNNFLINVSKPYSGMMKLYFPDGNVSINFISENKDVRLKFEGDKTKVSDIQYLDESNYVMNNLQDVQQKKEFILPALFQMKEYYKGNSDFGKSLEKEITRLSDSSGTSLNNHPFVKFYTTNYAKYLERSAVKKPITHEDIIGFLTNSNEMLESSSLLRPILTAYLNVGQSANVSTDIDRLLKDVDVETPRGQTILSELIEIFDMYEMKELKQKYLAEASNLKCTINDRLASTIASNKNTEIGATFANQIFKQATNTTAKSLLNVKADKKIIIFWSSTCSHCEAELPKILEKYKALKAQNVEVIGLSLDNEKMSYENKVKNLPWINDSELKGWYSSYVNTYNVHATPTYFILDAKNKIIAKPDHAADVISYFKLN